MRTVEQLNGMTAVQLRAELEAKGLKGISRTHKDKLVEMVMEIEANEAIEIQEREKAAKKQKTQKKSRTPEITMERMQDAEDLLATCCLKDTKTAKIMTLHLGGFTVSEIAQLLGIRYQMVYNIINK